MRRDRTNDISGGVGSSGQFGCLWFGQIRHAESLWKAPDAGPTKVAAVTLTSLMPW